MNDWFITDDDCLQHCRPIPVTDPTRFEFVQINSYPGHVDGTPFWQVAHGTIHIHDDYSDAEIQDMRAFYGYSDDAVLTDQIIAEMFFETEVQEYAESEHSSWNAAVARVAEITGLNLDQYLEGPTHTSLESQISAAKDRKVNTHTAPQTIAPELNM